MNWAELEISDKIIMAIKYKMFKGSLGTNIKKKILKNSYQSIKYSENYFINYNLWKPCIHSSGIGITKPNEFLLYIF